MCGFQGMYLIYSSIAQSVEHAAVNRAVVGSSPTRGVWLLGQVVKTPPVPDFELSTEKARKRSGQEGNRPE